MYFFLLNVYFSNRRKKGIGCIDLPIFILNLNYYATQSGRSGDPNLGRGPLFVDPYSIYYKRIKPQLNVK